MWTLRLVGLLAGLMTVSATVNAQPTIPDENRASLQTPPPRPAAESAQVVGAQLFDAIVRDKPELARGVFFPREAFLLVKAMQRPERYYARLEERFVADIHALHGALVGHARAEFVRLELGRRGGWVRRGEEGNRLPYWAARHATLHYRVDGQPKTLEIRVLISWGPRWYVIHLSEFRSTK
jgi:hypothetical protein